MPRMMHQTREDDTTTPMHVSEMVNANEERVISTTRRDDISSTPQADRSMNELELAAPIATLRSLGALKYDNKLGRMHPNQATGMKSSVDMLIPGILSEREASQAISM